MRTINKKIIILLICFLLISFLSGCTNWKKKYEALNVEHKNTLGLLNWERAEKGQLTNRASQDQRTIKKLRKEIAERNQTSSEISDFGQGCNASFDSLAGTVIVTLPNAILFGPGSATLKKTTSVELDHVQSVLKQKYPDKHIDVVGYTDLDPIKKSKWKDNWELSAQRALSVVRYLVAHGIAKDKIRAVAYGASRTAPSNAKASNKAKDRRVEIVIHGDSLLVSRHLPVH